MNKNALRKSYSTKREALSLSQILESSERICDQLFEGFELSKIDCLHSFVSLKERGEVDTETIISRVISAYPLLKILAPRVNNTRHSLEHLEVTAETEFEQSTWGIREPVGDKLIDEKLIDMVLVPLLCFDRRGHRVGYGGGYYDRFFAKCRPDCLKVGLSIFGPIDEVEDVHESDVRMDFCVTPERIFDFSLTID